MNIFDRSHGESYQHKLQKFVGTCRKAIASEFAGSTPSGGSEETEQADNASIASGVADAHPDLRPAATKSAGPPTFIRAAEIWLPDSGGLRLRLSASHYGDMHAFAKASSGLVYSFGADLPGLSWSERRPLVWPDLASSSFGRAEQAQAEGIACGLALPLFAGDFLMAVVVMFCNSSKDATGAVEVWTNAHSLEGELRLCEGYYGALEGFESISRRLSILRGKGLPGCAWEQAKPVAMTELNAANGFLRSTNAIDAGIERGLAIPVNFSEQDIEVLTFLAANGTPIARRFEIWIADLDREVLVFDAGHCESGADLAERYRGVAIHKGAGPLGEVWFTGLPSITDISGDAAEQMLLLPVIRNCRLSAVVALVL